MGAEVEEYAGVGGVRVFRIVGVVDVSVLAGDKVVGPVRATAVVAPGEEVILSDKTLDSLGIVLLRPGQGVWRFIDDDVGVERRSETPEFW